jgi:hypothetical protein
MWNTLRPTCDTCPINSWQGRFKTLEEAAAGYIAVLKEAHAESEKKACRREEWRSSRQRVAADGQELWKVVLRPSRWSGALERSVRVRDAPSKSGAVCDELAERDDYLLATGERSRNSDGEWIKIVDWYGRNDCWTLLCDAMNGWRNLLELVESG